MNKYGKHNHIVLELEGDKITADKFRTSIGTFYNLVDEIANQVSGKKKPINWIVTVKEGSITLISKPEPVGVGEDIVNTILDNINNGISILEKSPERPPYFSDKALEYIQHLASIPNVKSNGLNRIHISINATPHILAQHIVANVDSILGVYSKELGSIEGKLQTISERGGPKIIVYDALTDKPIRCSVTEEMLYEMTSAFGKRVYVYGVINYNKYGEPTNIKVEEFKIFPKEDGLPSASEICGILKD